MSPQFTYKDNSNCKNCTQTTFSIFKQNVHHRNKTVKESIQHIPQFSLTAPYISPILFLVQEWEIVDCKGSKEWARWQWHGYAVKSTWFSSTVNVPSWLGWDATINDGDKDLVWTSEASAEPATVISPFIVKRSTSFEPLRPLPDILQQITTVHVA